MPIICSPRSRGLLALAVPAALLAAAACNNPLEDNINACARPLIMAVNVQVRDAAGRPNAIGATVVARPRSGEADARKGYGDSLTIAAGEESGTYDVEVTKPYHTSALVRGVTPKQDRCGVQEPAVVPVTLTLLPGAPPVRQVVTPPHGYGFGWGGLTAQLTAFVEAAPGVSQAVTWVSRDTTVARITPEGLLTSRCRTSALGTWVVASSAVDPTRSDSVSVWVYADTDPIRCPRS
ncbi:MAG TPA: hypothetical protein VHG08_07430 [Longimicrobium sp.]|nr:hypothetical protein [Longimicrobium sp.]